MFTPENGFQYCFKAGALLSPQEAEMKLRPWLYDRNLLAEVNYY